MVQVNLKILLDSCFKPVFLKKDFKEKTYHFQLIKAAINDMLSNINYPHNFDGVKIIEYNPKITKKGLFIFSKVELDYDNHMQIRRAKNHNMNEFVKNIGIVNNNQ